MNGDPVVHVRWILLNTAVFKDNFTLSLVISVCGFKSVLGGIVMSYFLYD